MSFVSFQFAAFVSVCIALYYIFPKSLRYIVLLAASYAFYLIACGGYIAYIIVTTITTYLSGRIMGRYQEECGRRLSEPDIKSDRDKKKAIKVLYHNRSRMIMIVCLFLNFGILAVLKYSSFVIANINLAKLTFFHSIDFIRIPAWVLPLGLSFYTFQSMGYIIDLFYNRIKAERNPLKLALFVSFFPQIVQGPIGRYGELSGSLFEGNSFDRENMIQGALLIVSGLFKKLIIADRLSDYITNSMNLYESTAGGYLLLAVFLYSFQLYADFSGGIDIASGVACCFGVKLKANFMRPFFSGSASEYWRRWHISLADWFRDFLFYPIAVSKNMMKQGKWVEKHINGFLGKHYTLYIATAVVWFTTGLWHGAEWRYVVWGLLNGFIMCLSAELEPLYVFLNGRIGWKADGILHKAFAAVRTFWLITFLRLFDLSTKGMGQVRSVFCKIFTEFGRVDINGIEALGLPEKELKVALTGCLILMLVELLQEKESIYLRLKKCPEAVTWIFFVVSLGFIVIYGYYGLGYDAADFIYMQF